MIDRLFVYGTLQPGQPRWPALAGFVLHGGNGCRVTVTGTLYDTGYGWPAAIFGGGVDDHIPGIVLRLAPGTVDEGLAALDLIEGVGARLFERVAVEIDGYRCWAYQWLGDTEGFRRIESWPHTSAPGR